MSHVRVTNLIQSVSQPNLNYVKRMLHLEDEALHCFNTTLLRAWAQGK
jgi:hypothetical protein